MASISAGSVSANATGISCDAPTLLMSTPRSMSRVAATTRAMAASRPATSAASAMTVLVGTLYLASVERQPGVMRVEMGARCMTQLCVWAPVGVAGRPPVAVSAQWVSAAAKPLAGQRHRHARTDTTVRTNLLGKLVQRRLATADKHHAEALGRELARKLESDTGRAARDGRPRHRALGLGLELLELWGKKASANGCGWVGGLVWMACWLGEQRPRSPRRTPDTAPSPHSTWHSR